MTLPKSLIAFAIMFILVGCMRPQEEKSTVLLTFPTAPHAGSSKASVHEVTSSKILDDGRGGDWGLSDPSAISELGCYGVFVTGSENPSKCSIGSGSNFRIIQFKDIAGLTPAGSTIQLDLLPGDHTFYVVGMKKGSAACGSLSNESSIDSANYSNPILIGQATDNVAAGSDTVTINIALSTATIEQNKITNCAFMESEQLANLVFKGPKSASGATDNLVSLNLQNQLCGKYHIALSRRGQFESGGEGGGAINDRDRILKLNYGTPSVAGHPGWVSAPRFYTTPSCDANSEIQNNQTVVIPAGENAVEVYAHGSGAGWSSQTGHREFTLTDQGGFFPTVNGLITISAFSASAPKMNVMYEAISVKSGQCRLVDYYYSDYWMGNDYYVRSTAGTQFSIKKNDGVSAFNPPALSGLTTNCALPGSTSLPIPASTAYGVVGFKVDPSWVSGSSNDLLLASSASGAASPIYLNTITLGSGFTYQPALPNAPFASDCVTSNLKVLNFDNQPIEIFGYDAQGISKRIPIYGSAYGAGSGGPLFQGSSCVGNTFPQTWVAPTSASGATTSIPISFRPGYASGPLKVYAGGWPMLNGKSDVESGEVTINPRWDPGLIGWPLVKWVRPKEVSGGSTSWYGVPGLESYPFNVSSSVVAGLSGFAGSPVPTFVSAPELGINAVAASFTAVANQNIHISGLSSNVMTVAILTKLPVSASGTVGAIASFADNTTAMKYKVSYDGLAGQVAMNYVSTPVSSGWHVIHVKSENCSSSCDISYAVDGGSYVSAGSASIGPGIDYFALGAISGGIPSAQNQVAEVVVTTDSQDRRTLLNQYFKAKYPNAGIP